MFSNYDGAFFGAGESSVIASNSGVHEKIILHIHGAGDKSYTWMEKGERHPLFRDILLEGYSILSPELGGPQTWGNDAQQSKITQAYNYIKEKTGDDKIVIVGQSMGGLGAIVWASNNQDKVDRLALMIPVINLEDLHSRDDYYPEVIDSAYPPSGYIDSTMGQYKNPIRIAASGKLNDVNTCIWYGTSDELCKPNYVVDFSQSSGCSIVPVAGGHSDATVGRSSGARFRDFIKWR